MLARRPGLPEGRGLKIREKKVRVKMERRPNFFPRNWKV